MEPSSDETTKGGMRSREQLNRAEVKPKVLNFGADEVAVSVENPSSDDTPRGTHSRVQLKRADVKPKVLNFGAEVTVSAENPEENGSEGNVKVYSASPSPSAAGIDESSGAKSTAADTDGWNIYDDVSTLSNCSTTCGFEEALDTLASTPHDRRMGTIEQFCSPDAVPKHVITEWDDEVTRDLKLQRTPPSGGRWEWMKNFKRK